VSPRPAREPALRFIFVTLILTVLGFGIIIPVLPGLVTEFEGGNAAEGAQSFTWIIGSFALMQFIASPILGALSDQFGRRKVILLALGGAAIDYVVMGWAPTLAWLFVARVIAGLTAGALATCNAYIADVTPPEKRAQGFGLVGAAFGIGFVLGPVLGGVLGAINLRLPFFVAAACVGVNWLYGALVLPESLPPDKRRAFSWKRANPIGALLNLRRFHGLGFFAGMHFLFMLGHTMLQTTWVLYTSYRYGWSPAQVGVSLMLAGVAAAVVQGRLVGPILRRIGEKNGLILGLSLTVAVFVLYGLSTEGWMVYPIICLGGFAGITGPAAQALITRRVPADEQGAVQGVLSGVASLAAVIATPIGGFSFAYCIDPASRLHLPGIAFFEAAALCVAALMLGVRAVRPDAVVVPARV
jgi:DHA1 family tetracycline resistance protein-like MFS transporter